MNKKQITLVEYGVPDSDGNLYQKGCFNNLPKTVPVTKDFDNSNVLGRADIKEVDGNIIAEINTKFKIENVGFGVGGIVTERKDNIVTGFDIKTIGLILKL